MFLRSASEFEREAAQKGLPTLGRLAVTQPCGTVEGVVETLDEWVKTTCLYRYPSPVGRRSQTMARPPAFFSYGLNFCVSRQWFAQNQSLQSHALPAPKFAAIVSVKTAIEHKGDIACTYGTGFWGLQVAPRLRAVAETSANKRCWARGPARPQPLYWMAARQQVPSLGLRPTSPIANNTRRAAAKRVTPAFRPNLNLKPVLALSGQDGFFVAIAGGTRRRPRPEGTINVQ